MTKYIITGGSGFIGTHLITFLLDNNTGIEILNIDLQDSDIKDDQLNNANADIRSIKNLDDLEIEKGFNLCIHLAALSKEPGFEWAEYFETNYTGTQNVAKFCETLGV